MGTRASFVLWCVLRERSVSILVPASKCWNQDGFRSRYTLCSLLDDVSLRIPWVFPSVDIEVFSLALQHFAQAVGAGQHRRIVLVLDQAGWHESNEVVIPEGIHLLFLPPYSPELQPCERLWPLSNQAIANRRFESLEDLQEAQAARCVALQDDPLYLRQHTLFHWWPTSCPEEQDCVRQSP